MSLKLISVWLSALVLLAGCTTSIDLGDLLSADAPREAAESLEPVAPELDYSLEKPDCRTAGERIAAHVQVGMTLDEVTRLVGKPHWKVPGSWWWSNSFSDSGRPNVKFGRLQGAGDVTINAFSSATDGCS